MTVSIKMPDSSPTSSTYEWSSQAFRPQPAKSDERLWYRLHRLAKLLAMSFQRLRRPEFFRCGQGSRQILAKAGSMELGIFSNLSGWPAIRLYFASDGIKSHISWYLSSRANLSSSLHHVPINCRSFSGLGHLRDTVRSRDVVAARPRTWGRRQTPACWFYALIEGARTGHDGVEHGTGPDHRSWPPLAPTSSVSWRETPSQWWDDRPGKVWSSWIVIVNLFPSTIC